MILYATRGLIAGSYGDELLQIVAKLVKLSLNCAQIRAHTAPIFRDAVRSGHVIHGKAIHPRATDCLTTLATLLYNTGTVERKSCSCGKT